MAKFEDQNGVIWEVLIVGSTWAAQVARDSQKTYLLPGGSGTGNRTYAGVSVRQEWEAEREPALFGKLPAAQFEPVLNAFGRQHKPSSLAIKVTASPDKKDSGAILLLLLLAFVLFGGKKKR